MITTKHQIGLGISLQLLIYRRHMASYRFANELALAWMLNCCCTLVRFYVLPIYMFFYPAV